MPSVLVNKSLILILAVYSINCHYDYNYARRYINYEPPVNVMVDITNQLANNLLFYHSVGNDGNIAFSPSGLINVLIALYEGSDGSSAYEIYAALGLPWERDVIRLGYRDVHRRLRTYFLPLESFQSSLSLNHHNVTFTEAYRSVMRYYGYNFETGPEMAIPVPNNCTNEMDKPHTNTTENSTTIITPTIEVMTTIVPEEDRKMTTETLTTENTDEEGPSSKDTPDDIDTRFESEESTTELPTSSEVLPDVAEESATQLATEVLPDTMTEITESTSTSAPVLTEEIPPETAEPTTEEVAENTVSPITELVTPVTDLPEQNSEATSISEEMTETTIAAETEMAPTDETLLIVDEAQVINEDVISVAAEAEATARTGRAQRDPELVMPFRTPRGSIYTSYIVQAGVLLHASVARLGASVIRLPVPGVSGDQYHILVVLPWPGRSLDAVRRSLCQGDVTLRGLHAALRPTRGRAMVPKFRLKGLVDLTRDLRQMGAHRVFSPSLSDLRPMTPEPGVFVRAVEQDVNISVDDPPNELSVRMMSRERPEKFRDYPLDAWGKPFNYNGDDWYAGPIDFVADRPFLFYIMDSELYISLVAGRILDPTDKRIH